MEIKIVGVEEFTQYIGEQLDKKGDMSQLMQKYGSKLEQKAKSNAQFRGHYVGKKKKKFVKPTGATRQSITLTTTGTEAKVSAETEYSGYLELGTRKMEAQPFMKPALDAVYPEFIEELMKD